MEKVEKDYPKCYFLFTVTMLIDGKRKFIDIPVYSHHQVFPNRDTIFGFACNQFNIDPLTEGLYATFAVVNIFKFDNEEDYNSYIGNTQTETVEEDDHE